MATGLGGVNGCPEPDIADSRKRPLDSELDIGATKRSHHGGGNGAYHFKILVPAVAAGAIIGKGGETIAHLQKEAGARVKMSKANDFYPGTTERVCLITGSVEGILLIHEFIMEKIKEKPDPNAKMAIDFDHKQPAEREKQVKILVPNSTAGMIIGKGGSYIKQIKEESGAYVQISQKSKDHALAERCITVIGELENNKKACSLILAKVVEDPQSGSCLNVSYADVTGPVANFNPTGSPYANPGSVQGSGSSAMNNSNASYSSNGSLNSLSPTGGVQYQAQSQGSHQQGGQQTMPFSGMGQQVSSTGQLIESVKVMLRSSGYSEQATGEIGAAIGTLASYGMLGLLGLGGMFSTVNGAPPQFLGGLGLPSPSACGGMAQGMFATPSMVPLEPPSTPQASMAAAAAASSNSIFGPIGACSPGASTPIMVGSSMGFSSPTSRSSERFLTGEVPFDPFLRGRGASSPTLGSPPTAPSLPINNNSFGLGTGLSTSPLRKSPTLGSDRGTGETPSAKLEVEVGENIVGAILGPGGKSLVEIQRFSGANIQISKKGIFAPGTRNRIVTITGMPSSVSTAQYLIEQQINEEEAKRARQNAILR